MLGYTQKSWDNLSGREQLPWAFIKRWSSLTANEKEAAEFLGWTEVTWDDDSGLELPPVSSYKYWIELSACGEGEAI